MIPLAVLPGTGVGPFAAEMVYGHWIKFGDSLFPLPGRGLDTLDHTYSGVETQLLRWIDHMGQRIVLAGHSQGAYHAVRFAIRNPGRVLAVVGVAGPFGGSFQPPFTPPGVEWLTRKFIPVANDFKPNSSALAGLEAEVTRRWPGDVALTLVAGHRDQLVRPRRYALWLENDAIRKVYVGPWRPRGLPLDIEHVRAPFCGHTSQIFVPQVTRIIREARGL